MKRIPTLVLALAALAWAGDAATVKLHYDTVPTNEAIAAELSLSITIEGTDNATNFVRSMHPILSLQTFHVKYEGRHKTAGLSHKVEPEDARVKVRYDDEDSEHDWKKTEPPEDLGTNKLKQMIWYLAMSPRAYELTALGDYRSEDPNQDHNGEALDLYANGITRLKDETVKEGDTWTETWQGKRSEKNKKKAKWRFKQVVKVDTVEERAGRRVAVLTSDLTGTLEGDEDPTAEEKWAKCAGKTRVVIDVATGKIREQSGEGLVTAYYRNTAEDGSKNEVTIKLGAAGSRRLRR